MSVDIVPLRSVSAVHLLFVFVGESLLSPAMRSEICLLDCRLLIKLERMIHRIAALQHP